MVSQRQRAILYNTTLHIIKGIDCGKAWSHITGHQKCTHKLIIKPITEKTPEVVFLKAQKYICDNINKIIDDETNETHWIWLQSISKYGYGKCRLEGNRLGAHVVSWIAFNKTPVPAGLMVLHKCKQRRNCVNPEHLYVGTAKDNMADKKKDGTDKLKNNTSDEKAELIMISKGKGTVNERAIQFSVSESIIRSIDSGKTFKLLREKLKIPITNSMGKNLIPCPIIKIKLPIGEKDAVIKEETHCPAIEKNQSSIIEETQCPVKEENIKPNIISKIKLKLKQKILDV